MIDPPPVGAKTVELWSGSGGIVRIGSWTHSQWLGDDVMSTAASVPRWVSAKRSHAMDPHKGVIIGSESLRLTLCGIVLDPGEVHTRNVGVFGKMSTVQDRVECEGCRNEAVGRDVSGVAHRDYHAVGDARALPDSA